MNIGFIGCGNMARPIINAVLSEGVFAQNEIFVFDINTEMLKAFCDDLKITAALSAEEIIKGCDTVVLSVKPQVFATLLPTLKIDVEAHRPFLISIAAGKKISQIAQFFDAPIAIARVFPNLNAQIKAAVSAYCVNKFASEEQLRQVKQICESFGSAYQLDEEQFPVFGVLGGCSPAYSFMYVNALAEAAHEAGLDKKLALEVASRAVAGSAQLLPCVENTPLEMVNKVCSPGGTTIEGVISLAACDFANIIKKAFNASLNKDKILSQS